MPPGPAFADRGEPDMPSGAGGAQPVATTLLDALTDKQREVLDLLIQHKTSKEISRELNISPHTVDQRIMLARAKLNVASRGEVAQEYRRLLGQAHEGDRPARSAPQGPDAAADACEAVYERSVYDSSHVDPAPPFGHASLRDDMVERRQAPTQATVAKAHQWRQPGQQGLAEPYYHVLPEMFDGPYGTLLRLGAIAAITVFLILIVLGGLTMFTQLSHIIDR